MSDPLQALRDTLATMIRVQQTSETDDLSGYRAIYINHVSQLFAEVDRLKAENEQLQIENRRLLVASYRA